MGQECMTPYDSVDIYGDTLCYRPKFYIGLALLWNLLKTILSLTETNFILN
jgi:hypothetical protein